MDYCVVAVPNVSYKAFDHHHNILFALHNNNNNNNNNNNHISPNNNVMVSFHQQLEGVATRNNLNQSHYCNEVPLLKRKRPARISVPTLSENIVIGSPTTKVVRVDEEIEVEGDGYGVYCKKGKSRAHLEDRHSVLFNDTNNVGGHSKQTIFGIYDGHGGAKAAEFVAARLGYNILDHVNKAKSDKQIEEKIRDGYLAADKEFLKGDNSSGGVCCVTALIQDGELMVSNIGDCRAVISRGGLAEALTIDHSPSREDEKSRIQSKGGYVDCCNGVWRIQGSLAVSRAIGDQHLKQWVIAEPDTTILTIEPEFDFLILASDGLWNKVTNQEAVDVVLPFFTGNSSDNNNTKIELKNASRKLAELSISRGSGDDTSVMVIQLGRFAN